MSWTQAICESCWNAQHPEREPVRVVEGELTEPEQCAFCGRSTRSGIYTRANPAEVPFPSRETA